jgi:hypothetical protein
LELWTELETWEFGAGCDRGMVVAVLFMPLLDGLTWGARSENRMSDQSQFRGEEFSFFQRFVVQAAVGGLPFASAFAAGSSRF